MDSMIKTDVCIIGAGPSGASTSMMLSKHQIEHYVIDKASFPRDKTCGDGLILYAYKSLKILGLFDEFLKNPKFIHSKKIKLHINNQLNVKFQEAANRDMIISYARRFDFDHFLVNNMDQKFAHLELGNGVKSIKEQEDGVVVKLKDGKQILAKIVVGADGAQSIVSRKLAANKVDRNQMSTFVSAYFEGVSDMPVDHEAEVRMIYKDMPLFFYIFPLADGHVNVSLGGRADKIQECGINLVEEVESILKSHSRVSYKFTKARMSGTWRGWTIPFHFGKQSVSGNRYVLVGDAAGLANAFYKEGVGTGMMSGIIAANTISGCVKADSFDAQILNSYEKELQKEFGKLLKFSGFALRTAKHKRAFAGMASLFKKRIERKTPDVVKRRSY